MKRLTFTLIGLGLLFAAPAFAQPAADEAPEGLQVQDEAGDEDEGVAEAPEVKDELNSLLNRARKEPQLVAPGSDGEQTLIRLANQDKVPEAAYALGVAALRRGDTAKATEYLQKTLALDPNFSDAVAQLGIIQIEKGEKEAGEAKIQQAVEMDKYCAVSRNYLALAALKANQLDDTIKHCRIALLGDPSNMTAYLNMAIAWMRKDRLDVAMLVVKSALAIEEHNAPILNVQGLIELKKENIKGAFTSFEKAAAADATFVDARRNLAAIALNYKDFDAALRYIDEVLKLLPDNPEFLLSRAVALRGMERFDDAKAVLTGILDKDPGNKEARYNLCLLLNDYLTDYNAALTQCTQFKNSIDKNHPKWKEMELKVKGINETIKALEEMKKLESEESKPDEGKAEEKAEEAPAEEGKVEEKAEEAPAEEGKVEEKAEEAPAEEGKVEEKAEEKTEEVPAKEGEAEEKAEPEGEK